MPGPMLSATISESVRRGGCTEPLFILGHGILEMILIAALFLGLAPFLQHPLVFRVVALAGGSFIIFMAAGMFRYLKTLSLLTAGEKEVKSNLVMLGAGLSLANPYWIIWWATIGMGYILSAGKSGFSGVSAFFAGRILADLVWYSFVSFEMAKSRSFMSDRVYPGL
ncbi:MAG: LysE family transporter [Spirochaetales bacterium]|nr:LysE family transporter [Spirochaetales bacterium]